LCSRNAYTYMWFSSVPDLVFLTLCQWFCPLASVNVFATFDFCVSALPGMSTPVPSMLFWFRTHPAWFFFFCYSLFGDSSPIYVRFSSVLVDFYIITNIYSSVHTYIHTHTHTHTHIYIYIYIDTHTHAHTEILYGIVADRQLTLSLLLFILFVLFLPQFFSHYFFAILRMGVSYCVCPFPFVGQFDFIMFFNLGLLSF